MGKRQMGKERAKTYGKKQRERHKKRQSGRGTVRKSYSTEKEEERET
jgi:hypothetical protein